MHPRIVPKGRGSEAVDPCFRFFDFVRLHGARGGLLDTDEVPYEFPFRGGIEMEVVDDDLLPPVPISLARAIRDCFANVNDVSRSSVLVCEIDKRRMDLFLVLVPQVPVVNVGVLADLRVPVVEHVELHRDIARGHCN